MISALLKHLPPGYAYKVIFMQRRMEEILASQRQMLIRRGEPADSISDQKMTELFSKHLEQVQDWIAEQPNVDAIYVSYNEILEDPTGNVEKIDQFLGQHLDKERMVSVIDEDLYRQRK